MSGLPRLLYLGHNLPFPPNEGALIRSYHTVRLLSRSFDLTGLYFFRRGALPTAQEREAGLAAMASFGSARAFPIDEEWSRARLVWDHLRSIASSQPYTRWTHESEGYRRAVEDLLSTQHFDIVHVDSLDLMAYLPRLRGIPVVLAHHNVESSLLRRRAEPESGLRRAYIEHQARLVAGAEREWCGKVSLNVAVSDSDAEQFRAMAPGAEVMVIPNGVDTRAFTPSQTPPTGDLVFVGGYSWFPNADGMEFFARNVLPLLREEVPSLRVIWIGKAPPEAVARFADLGVTMLGYVEDIRPHMHAARCVIVPLRVGGGTRLKILDAWAMGKAVVSTSRGCEGLKTRHGENILVADDPARFAAECVRVLSDASLRATLEDGARRTAVESYDWDALGAAMTDRYLKVIGRG